MKRPGDKSQDNDLPDRQRHHPAARKLQSEVRRRGQRKLAARRKGQRSVWFGLGTFGLIGWSVAIPALLGVAIGLWIDTRWPSRFSWTLMLLFLGVILGCANGWYWIQRETRDEED